MSAPTSRKIPWLSLVLEADPGHYDDPVAYRFSNGRTFKCTDRRGNGIYSTGGDSSTWQGDQVSWHGDDVTW